MTIVELLRAFGVAVESCGSRVFEFCPPFQFSICSQGSVTLVYGLRHGVDKMSTNLVLVLPHGGVTV